MAATFSVMSTSANALRALVDRRLVVVTGKGGVGKSAVAAALALFCAGQGKRVLLLEVDARENACQMFGIPPSAGELIEAAHGVWLQNLKPRDVLDRIVRERVRLGVLAKKVLASPIYHQLTEGMPGLRQLALIDHARELTASDSKEERFDLVILDAPATGHGISLLDSPRLISEVISDGPIGEMAQELAALVAEPEQCAVVVVALAEEMPVQETLELAAKLEARLGRGPELLAINGLYPEVTASAAGGGKKVLSKRSSTGTAAGDAMRALWHRRREINERELERLERAWKGPHIELPLLPIERGPELARRLAAVLEEA